MAEKTRVNVCNWDFFKDSSIFRRPIDKVEDENPHTTGLQDPLGEAQLTASLAELGLSDSPPEEQFFQLALHIATLAKQCGISPRDFV